MRRGKRSECSPRHRSERDGVNLSGKGCYAEKEGTNAPRLPQSSTVLFVVGAKPPSLLQNKFNTAYSERMAKTADF
jgi:hypothetical protein